MQRAMQRWWLCALVVGVLIAVLVDLKAQPAPGEDAQLLTIDTALGLAASNGDKSAARKLLALQFSFVDENGKVHVRKDFLADLKASAAAAPSSDAKVKVYGLVAMVTGHRKSAHAGETFFIDIWAKQKGAWRALTIQDVVLGPTAPPRVAAAASNAEAKPYECKNPCQAIPYRVRSPAEQDVVNSFQAIEKAAVAHDADDWSKHIADEFVLYGSGRAPIAKSDRIAAIKRQKESNVAVTVGEIETMHLSVYGDSAAMTATHIMPDNSRPPYHAARVWVKRNGQWQMTISAQTDIK